MLTVVYIDPASEIFFTENDTLNWFIKNYPQLPTWMLSKYNLTLLFSQVARQRIMK